MKTERIVCYSAGRRFKEIKTKRQEGLKGGKYKVQEGEWQHGIFKESKGELYGIGADLCDLGTGAFDLAGNDHKDRMYGTWSRIGVIWSSAAADLCIYRRKEHCITGDADLWNYIFGDRHMDFIKTGDDHQSSACHSRGIDYNPWDP